MIIGREGKGQGKTPLFSSQIFEEAGDITHMYNVHSTSLFRFLISSHLISNKVCFKQIVLYIEIILHFTKYQSASDAATI